MTITMFRDCMNLMDEVRLLSLGVKSPTIKTPVKNKREAMANQDERRKRSLEDTPLSSSKRRKR